MNIVYISCLSGNKAAGLTYSIPAQIESQSKIDNVYWYNLDRIYKRSSVGVVKCNSVDDIPTFQICQLPAPFDRPDIVIFEGYYFILFCKIAKDLKRLNIPYVIVPRGSLTKDAQKSKIIKKRIANIMFFNRFAHNAAAIQYLTNEEYQSSGKSWNQNSLIIPNGTEKKSKSKVWDSKTILRGVFIGRLDIYHKGIDLLIEACALLKGEMKAANCIIDIYGPDQKGSKTAIKKLVMNNELEDFIQVNDAIFDDEKEAVLLDSDFFILTSRFEGHPMGLIEALSYGLPCLVTTGSNMADQISGADAGWTAEMSVDSIVKSFNTLLNDKERFAEKGQYALGLSKQYDWDPLGKISSEKYRGLLK